MSNSSRITEALKKSRQLEPHMTIYVTLNFTNGVCFVVLKQFPHILAIVLHIRANSKWLGLVRCGHMEITYSCEQLHTTYYTMLLFVEQKLCHGAETILEELMLTSYTLIKKSAGKHMTFIKSS